LPRNPYFRGDENPPFAALHFRRHAPTLPQVSVALKASKPLRLLLVGSRHFTRPLSRALACVPMVEVVDVAETAAEASAIARLLEPDVLLVEAELADAVGEDVPEGRVVVIAPWVVKWRDADESAAVSRTDLLTAAVQLAAPARAVAATS
jgi:hypothetical protein